MCKQNYAAEIFVSWFQTNGDFAGSQGLDLSGLSPFHVFHYEAAVFVDVDGPGPNRRIVKIRVDKDVFAQDKASASVFSKESPALQIRQDCHHFVVDFGG